MPTPLTVSEPLNLPFKSHGPIAYVFLGHGYTHVALCTV